MVSPDQPTYYFPDWVLIFNVFVEKQGSDPFHRMQAEGSNNEGISPQKDYTRHIKRSFVLFSVHVWMGEYTEAIDTTRMFLTFLRNESHKWEQEEELPRTRWKISININKNNRKKTNFPSNFHTQNCLYTISSTITFCATSYFFARSSLQVSDIGMRTETGKS